MTDHYVQTAMTDGGIVDRDDRGLMPLAEARAWLANRHAYVKGDFLPGAGAVLESDRTWAAILSLADGEEFLAVARRLSWEFEVRGMANLAAWQRYGDAVLGWIAHRVDADGVLHNQPWCLLPCLLASDAPAAFDVAATIKGIAGAQPQGERSVLARWVLAHPEPGYRLLGERVRADQDGVAGAAALEAIEELFAADPRGTEQALAAAIGAAPAAALLADFDLAAPAVPAEVVEALANAPEVPLAPSTPVSIAEMDDCFTDFETPIWDNTNYFCAAMRLTGYVTPGGADGLVIQQLMTGLGGNDIRLEFATYGFGTAPGVRWAGGRTLVDETITDTIAWNVPVALTMANGEITVTPTRSVDFPDSFGPMETAMLLATVDPAGCDRTFLNADQLVRHLELPAAAQAMFALDSFEQPDAGCPASDSIDLVLAVEALRARRAITSGISGRTRSDQLRDRIDNIGGWGGED